MSLRSYARSFLAAVFLGSTACSGTDHFCTLIGCDDGIDLVVDGIATKLAADLPVTLDVCVGASCASFVVDTATPSCAGCPNACTPTAATFAGNCYVIDGGTVEISQLALPAGASAGDVVAVHLMVTGGKGAALVDVTQTTTLTALSPNGASCGPTCNRSSVTIM